MNVNTLTPNDPLLPASFRHIPDAPKQLYYRGDLQGFATTTRVAVVGSRRATSYGRAVTTKLVQELAAKGVIIVSGLALGIDGIAHQAALDAGGRTVAVLACGLDRIYPASHTRLAERLLERGGALISEYPAGTEPLQHQFIARNRLVSGLSDAVLITEAAEKSGSLHTANFALEQGKTVLVVPGNITSPLSAGTNNLIKAGALPVTDTQDILQALGLDAAADASEIIANDANEQVILNLLARGICDANELCDKSQLETRTFNQTLTMLELNGKIRPLGANQWVIR